MAFENEFGQHCWVRPVRAFLVADSSLLGCLQEDSLRRAFKKANSGSLLGFDPLGRFLLVDSGLLGRLQEDS